MAATRREWLGKVGLWVSRAATGGQAGAGDFARRVGALGIPTVWVGGGNPDDAALQERGDRLAATEHLVVATGIVNIWAWDPARLHTHAAAPEQAVVVNPDSAAARGVAREYLATYLTLPSCLSNLRRSGLVEDDFAVAAVTASSTPSCPRVTRTPSPLGPGAF